MTFKQFCDNVRKAHYKGSFSMALVTAFLAVIAVLVFVTLMVAMPGIGFSIVLIASVARIIYAGLRGK